MYGMSTSGYVIKLWLKMVMSNREMLIQQDKFQVPKRCMAVKTARRLRPHVAYSKTAIMLTRWAGLTGC